MNDLIIPVNNEALSRAMIACVGEQATTLITTAYQAIDKAMAFGYAKSQEEEAEKRKVLAEEYMAAVTRAEAKFNKEAFDAGFSAGYQEAIAEDEFYDTSDDSYGDDDQLEFDFGADAFDDLEPKENSAVEGEWSPAAQAALDGTIHAWQPVPEPKDTTVYDEPHPKSFLG